MGMRLNKTPTTATNNQLYMPDSSSSSKQQPISVANNNNKITCSPGTDPADAAATQPCRRPASDGKICAVVPP